MMMPSERYQVLLCSSTVKWWPPKLEEQKQPSNMVQPIIIHSLTVNEENTHP